MLCQKKKKVSPATWNGGNEKKIKKKNVQSRQPVTDWHVSDSGSFPPFETAGMRKTTKKKPQKWKWVILKFFFKGGQTWKYFWQ